MAAHVIGRASKRLTTALLNIVAGLLGLVCIVLWIAFHVQDRVRDWWSPAPQLVSLRSVGMTQFMAPDYARSVASTQLVEKLKNANTDVIRVQARFTATLNG